MIVGVVLFVFYVTIGFQFFDFYFGGKKTIIVTGEEINKLCNDNGSCPKELSGWEKERDGMRKDSMIYFFYSAAGSKPNEDDKVPQNFRIVYEMPSLTDHWFEVQGGGRPTAHIRLEKSVIKSPSPGV